MYEVLIIDDSSMQRENISKILHIKCKDVVVYDTDKSETALEIIKNKSLDIILLDLMMPGMSGFKILEMAKQINKNIKVFIISGINSEEARKQCFALGASYYFVKPIDLDRLAELVMCN